MKYNVIFICINQGYVFVYPKRTMKGSCNSLNPVFQFDALLIFFMKYISGTFKIYLSVLE